MAEDCETPEPVPEVEEVALGGTAKPITSPVRTVNAFRAGAQVCAVCGAPVPRGSGRRPREKHDACRRASGFLAAATRATLEIIFYETPASIDARTRLRGDIIALANIIPVKWHALRDSRGRFVAGEGRHE